jgi:hypothetical protein
MLPVAGSLKAPLPGYLLPAGNIVGALYNKLETQSSAPEDGRNHRPKRVELIGIINKPLLLHMVGCQYYLHIISILHNPGDLV